MTFNIRKTDRTLLASIPAGSYNSTATSLILFGKNFANYGTALNEDLVHLLENFADSTPPLHPIVGQLWFDTTRKEMKVWQLKNNVYQWVLLNADSLQSIAEAIVPNRFYVTPNGDDANSGKSWFSAKKTIKSACDAASTSILQEEFPAGSVSILVSGGDYTEICPITVPAGVSLIGDNQRSVTVRPSVVNSDVFYLNSGSYVYGITVRGHQLSPSALDITPYNSGNTSEWANASGLNAPRNSTQTGWAFGFAPGAVILISPYIQSCSSISGDPSTDSGVTPGGGGVLVDPGAIDASSRVHSIVCDGVTAINLGGIGCKVVGKGFAQLGNFYTVFCQFGILAVDGGQAQLNASNVSFGNYALWSEGYRWMDNPTAVNQSWTSDGTSTQFLTTANTKVYPEQYTSLVLEVNGVQQIYNTDFTLADGANNNTVITLLDPPTGVLSVQAKIRWTSLIDAGTFSYSYAGAGITYSDLSLSQGGVGRGDANKYTIAYTTVARNLANTANAINTLNETVFTSGRIYQNATDERGRIYMGLITPGTFTGSVQSSPIPSLLINQQDGVIEGKIFYNSIFSFMAPFILALTRKGN